jgi:hypothetical protein
VTVRVTVPGPKTRKPDSKASPRTRRRRKLEEQRRAGTAPMPAAPPVVLVDDIDTGGAGRVEIRREVARLMAVEGKTPALAVPELCDLFGIEERQAFRYAAFVRKAWADLEVEERPGHRAWLLQVQAGVLADARGAGPNGKKDHQAANGAIRNLIDLLGLKVSKVELQQGGLDALVAALKATPAQREARIAEIEAKARAEGVDLERLGDGTDPG